mmetsp:Transcript_10577/g.13760  ORF Transcript_10577/g.13760 Transcript_10577/m.13760 type:complete len:600 (+) Transcript_10577:26-1825(+)
MLSWNKVTTLSILLAIPIADAFGTVNAPLQRNSHVLLASTTTTPTSDDNIVVTPSGEGNKEVDVSNTRPVVIVGGGPAGLLTAIMCAKTLGTERPIKVYDRLSPPLNPRDDAVWSDVTKFYLIGLNGRGQKALQKYGVWDAVESVCTAVVGRKDWAPNAGPDEGVERIFGDERTYTTQVLPRDKLVGVLHEHILNELSDQIEINYGYEVEPKDLGDGGNGPVILSVSRCTEVDEDNDEDEINCDIDAAELVEAEMLIAADGTGRTIANEMEASDLKNGELKPGNKFKVTRYVDDNRRIYKTVPLKLPADWRHDLNYSARTNRFNIDALPADSKGNYCGVLLLKEDDALAAADTDPKDLRKFFDENLSQFSSLIDDEEMATIAKKKPSFLPSFRYVSPRLHHNSRTVLVGDCAHTVKPYFGLGANSALEDISVLGDVLSMSQGNISDGKVVQEFSRLRAKEAKSLVEISRNLDRPGKLGVLTFIFPLIVDSIFNKLAPSIFAPNIFGMLQNDALTFESIQRRKRIDRVSQSVALGVLFGTIFSLAKLGLSKLLSSEGRIVRRVVGFGCSMFLLGKGFSKINPNIAVADVLAKLSRKKKTA